MPINSFSETAQLLMQCVSVLAHVDDAAPPGCVARLDLGKVPVLHLDVTSPAEDQCWALAGALRALTCGPEQATGARRPRHLCLVS